MNNRDAIVKTTATMQLAINLARANGGSLRYHTGGWWAEDSFVPPGRDYVGRQTIDALIKRGLMQFTEHSAKGYPTRAALVGYNAAAEYMRNNPPPVR